jgi:hypothetical protein
MTFTRSQLHERISDLSGQYRAARENKRLTSEKRAEQERLSELARQADEKADAQLADVVALLREAKASYADAVEEIIAPDFVDAQAITTPEITAEEALRGFNSVFNQPADFQARALQNGAERIEQACNEATQ